MAGGGLQRRKLGYPGFYCQGGEGCISSVREDWRLGKLPCFFLCRGTAPGRGGPPWQAAVFEEEVLDVPGFTVREGRAVYFQSGRTVSWENCRAAFCRSTASGRGGPPWQTAVREFRCLVQVLFMRLGFQKPSA